ncbi:nuclear transport factor 2 family protein [Glycomyces terrestris]|uniref:Nuclear transport factor 2 family protein n=1 Tax=Glycomyces terrestris TaxID=2493553 RepID=A0A426V3X9_9ACTN|nr:nuclear transport factor 2 family protein [Glycomyces terrestris]RRS01545.1 nuclear transport factor 2 family protein [Glycomyces terrestris]
MSIESEVGAVAVAFDAALVRNDADEIAGFLADDWVYVGPDGMVTKAELTAWIASGRLAHHSMAAAGPERTLAAGDALLVTARRRSTGSWEGEPYATDEWISDLWVRSGDSWRCALTQKTPA